MNEFEKFILQPNNKEKPLNQEEMIYPATMIQNALYQCHKHFPYTNTFVISDHFPKNITKVAAEEAINKLVTNYSILRTSFYEENGILFSKIHKNLTSIHFHCEKMSPTKTSESYFDSPLCMSDPGLFRFIYIENNDHAEFVFIVHHIIVDMFSLLKFNKSFLNYLLKNENQQIELERNKFSIFSKRERDFLKSDDRKKSENYWNRLLIGLDSKYFQLNENVGILSPNFLDHHIFDMNDELKLILKLCEFSHVSYFSVIMSLTHLALARITSCETTILSYAPMIRDSREISACIGPCYNILPYIFHHTPGKNYKDIFHEMKKQHEENLLHSHIPFPLMSPNFSPTQAGMPYMFNCYINSKAAINNEFFSHFSSRTKIFIGFVINENLTTMQLILDSSDDLDAIKIRDHFYAAFKDECEHSLRHFT
ncbi:MAG: hypothetical protein A3F10_06500 [Coxiella sp. RIFCSPHIGHO2_12_FULL_42_15]|nr:MAG: hypothetical protein A3F10_06500 [Coxiella sp. RIFCSPHIGHO2_12_FULL_42_15]